MAVELADYQLEAIKKLKTGSILCGGVGSGKSRTALAYYFMQECKGSIRINGEGDYIPMKDPKDLYIITTAKKRDSNEWLKEAAMFALIPVVDSWNNIKKYIDVSDAFFIFDVDKSIFKDY